MQNDNVNHPSYYNNGKVEVIDAIEAWGLNFHSASTDKRIAGEK